MNSAPQLQTALDQALSTQPQAVVLDMTEVGFLGSAGLSVLLVAAQSAPAGGLRVVTSPAARRPIEVTSLDELLRLFPTVEAALAAPQQPAS